MPIKHLRRSSLSLLLLFARCGNNLTLSFVLFFFCFVWTRRDDGVTVGVAHVFFFNSLKFSFFFDLPLFHQCSSHDFFSLFPCVSLSDNCRARALSHTLNQSCTRTHTHTHKLRAESNRHVQWFSESDVSDINESDSRPASPVTVLEAVDGVQPELQHTQKESELVSKSRHTHKKNVLQNLLAQHFFLNSFLISF